MAFSVFLRNSGCSSRVLSGQAMKLVSQSPIVPRSINTLAPVRRVLANDLKTTTPIFNAVRALRTSNPLSASHTPHDHARLWVMEKITAAALIPLVPIGLLVPNKLVDMLLAVLIVAHSHWGLKAVAVEYVREILFGPFWPKVARGVVYGYTVITLGGLFYLTFNDIGICRSFWKIWRNMRKPAVRYCLTKHTYTYAVWGLEAIAVDYVRATIFGPFIPKLAIALVYLLSAATLGGLFYVIINDIGICHTIRKLWSVKAEKKQ